MNPNIIDTAESPTPSHLLNIHSRIVMTSAETIHYYNKIYADLSLEVMCLRINGDDEILLEEKEELLKYLASAIYTNPHRNNVKDWVAIQGAIAKDKGLTENGHAQPFLISYEDVPKGLLPFVE